MNRNALKRALSIVVVLVLVCGLGSSCTKKEEPKTETTKTETAKTETTKTDDKDSTATEDDGITWSGTISVASYAFGPMDEEADIVGPYIEERLLEYGLDVDLEYMYIEYPNYQEVINTRLVGGMAPDIFLSLSLDNQLELYKQGTVATWTPEFFKKNAPHIVEYVEKGGIDGRQSDSVDLWWDYAMQGDDMYTIPKFTPGQNIPYKNVVYRTDWLEALDVKELPLTVDDYVDLMYRFANEDPDGNGKKDTYGMSSSMVRALFGAYGNYNGFIGDSPHWYKKGDQMVCADILPENKEVLTILAKMYKDKVLHPEFITRENEGGYWALSHHMINGQIGVSCLASIDHYRYPEVSGEAGPCLAEYKAVNGADESVTYGPWPAGPDGEYGYKIGYGVSVGENALYNASLNDDPEKLAAILQIVDIFSQDDELAKMATWGVEGKNFEYTGPEGKEGVKLLFENNEEMNKYGVQAYRSLYGADTPYNEHVQRAAILNNPNTLNRVSLMDNNAQWKAYKVSDLYVALPSEGDYKEELKTYRDETWVGIITGELSVDYYDTYVEEYLAKGGAVLQEEANEWLANK